MNKDMKKKRVEVLAELDKIRKYCCLPCIPRITLSAKGDSTGMYHLCKACPTGKDIEEVGKKLSKLTKS